MKIAFKSLVFLIFAAIGGVGESAWAIEQSSSLYEPPLDPPPAVKPARPNVGLAPDDPAAFVLSGDVGYEHHFTAAGETGLTGNRIRISFEPTVSFLPASITIDLGNGQITAADLTLLRIWYLSLLSYHRNIDASVNHDLEIVRVRVPILTTSAGNKVVHTSLVVSVSGEIGVRWMRDGASGFYAEPQVIVSSTTTLLNQIFATAYLKGSATAIAYEPCYLSAALGGRVGVKLTTNNMLRLVFTGSLNFDGANAASGLPTVSEYLGAGLEWGAQPSLTQNWLEGGRR